MAENTTPKDVAEQTTTDATPATAQERNKNLETDFGTTSIDDVVVSKIAGIAAREVLSLIHI